MAVTPPYGLRDLQWRFVQEYLIDLNATHAYQRAGYKAAGKAAEANASRLLRNAKVKTAIQAEKEARNQRVHLTQDAVLEELALLSHSDLSHYAIDAQGNVILVEGAPANAMRAVASLKKKVMYTAVGVTYETEIRLWNKPASVRMAGEHLGTFKEGVVQSADIQAAQAARTTAIQQVQALLTRIRARYAHAAEVGIHEPLPS